MTGPTSAIEQLHRRNFGTPAPQYAPPPVPVPIAEQRDRIPAHDSMWLRAAAYRAARVLPEAIGLLVQRELVAVAEMSVWAGRSGMAGRVAAEVMALPMPGSAAHDAAYTDTA